MKQRGMFLISLSILFFISIQSAEAKPNVQVFNSAAGKAFPYYKFDGFSFGGYSPSPDGIDKIIAQEMIEMKKTYPATKPSYAIIGHSQGGLRVLAFSTYLKNTNPEFYDRLQAVITVSGIDKGLKALDGGVGTVKAKIDGDINTLYRGINGMLRVIPMINIQFEMIKLVTGISSSDIQIGLRNFIINNVLPPDVRAYIKPAYEANQNLDQMAEIRDMIPRSPFIKTYVTDSKDHTYRVQTGTHLVWAWRSGWLGIPYYWGYLEPVYTWYTMTEDQPKIPPEMPIGYIVGLNSNTLSMCDSGVESKIRGYCSQASSAFNVAGKIHVAQCVFIYGLFLGSVGYAQDCYNAASWVDNIDAQLNEIKGSVENDGLVAKESQYIQKEFTDPNTGVKRQVHPNVLSTDPRGYTELPKYNHKDIDYADNVDVDKEYKSMLEQAVYKRQR